MARTTRSTAAQQEKAPSETEKQETPSSPPATRKLPGKKRKRPSDIEHDDQPAAKLVRPEEEEANVKEETPSSSTQPAFAGDLHIPQDDANKILDILDMIDTQGLLDRVFPLHSSILNPASSSSPSTSKVVADSFSLRNLLTESHVHPLRVLRSAINQLFPISSHPRSKTSVPAAQQQRFCELASHLLEQASISTIGSLNLTPELILGDHDTNNSHSTSHSVVGSRHRKYALVQRLAGGDWWTSSNADIPGMDPKSLKDLRTGHAELVSVLPSLSDVNEQSVPTLGEFYVGKKAPVKAKPPGPRYTSCGTYLDYGPYASFAPTFDSEGAEVGRYRMGEVFWRRHQKGKMREQVKVLRERIQARATEVGMDIDEVPLSQTSPVATTTTAQTIQESREDDHIETSPAEAVQIDPALQEQDAAKEEVPSLLLPSEESAALQNALEHLAREKAISELLEQNAKALLRLETLQLVRLGGDKGGTEVASEDSDEWKTAHSIMDSLALLTSLRPRASTKPDEPAIVPPSPVLRTLHKTVFTQPTQGWYGTLAEGRGNALRDDSTINTKAVPVLPVPVQPPATPAKTSALPTYSTPATSSTQQNYSYAGYSQPYRGTYPYTQGQAGSYYPNTYTQGSTAVTAPTPSTPYSGTSQPQYPYNSWLASYQQATSVAGATTPTTPLAGSATNYASYTTPGASRAIANTVASGKTQANGWAKSSGYTPAPTLPTHLQQLRQGGVGAYTPSTPTPLSTATTVPAASGISAGYQPTSTVS